MNHANHTTTEAFAMSELFDKHGGFRRLHSFTLATIVQLDTLRFCRRFLTSDPREGAMSGGQLELAPGNLHDTSRERNAPKPASPDVAGAGRDLARDPRGPARAPAQVIFFCFRGCASFL